MKTFIWPLLGARAKPLESGTQTDIDMKDMEKMLAKLSLKSKEVKKSEPVHPSIRARNIENYFFEELASGPPSAAFARPSGWTLMHSGRDIEKFPNWAVWEGIQRLRQRRDKIRPKEAWTYRGSVKQMFWN